jgi:hypothetical protein
MTDTRYPRKAFISKAFHLALTFFLIHRSGYSAAGAAIYPGEAVQPLKMGLNPAFRLKRFQDGSMELSTCTGSGERITYRYQGVEAALLLMLAQHRQPLSGLQDLSSAFSMDKGKMQAKIEQSVADFKSKALICSGNITVYNSTVQPYA